MGKILYQQCFVCLCILLALPAVDVAAKKCSGYGQFFGGSVSYTLDEVGGKFTVFNLPFHAWLEHIKTAIFFVSKFEENDNTHTRTHTRNRFMY